MLRGENFAVDIARNGEDGGHLGATERLSTPLFSISACPKLDGVSVLEALAGCRTVELPVSDPDGPRRLVRQGRRLQGRGRRLSHQAFPKIRGAGDAPAGTGAQGRGGRGPRRSSPAARSPFDAQLGTFPPRRAAAQADRSRMARPVLPKRYARRVIVNSRRPDRARLRGRRGGQLELARGHRREAFGAKSATT